MFLIAIVNEELKVEGLIVCNKYFTLLGQLLPRVSEMGKASNVKRPLGCWSIQIVDFGKLQISLVKTEGQYF